MQNFYSQHLDIQKAFDNNEIDFLEYSTKMIEWNNQFSNIIEKSKFANDPSHGGKLKKKTFTDKRGKKTTKWVKGNEDVKDGSNGSSDENGNSLNPEQNYSLDEWKKSSSKATDKALVNASMYAASSEIRSIARNELLKRQLVDKNFMDLSLMPDFMLDSFIDKYTYDHITPQQNDLLSKYRDNDYVQLNKKIREGEALDDNQKKMSKEISKAIQGSELQHDITLWRGLSGKNSLMYITMLKSLKPGDQFKEESFTSSSLVQGQAIKFRDLYKDTNNLVVKILASKGSKALSMQNLGNADEKIMYSDEYEFLLDKGSTFQIVESKDNEITVKLVN